MNSIPNAEATVVRKLNQGTIRQTGCNRLSVSFFVTFLDKQKSKIEILKYSNTLINIIYKICSQVPLLLERSR